MPLKTVPAANTPAAIVIILGPSGTQGSTNIAKSSKHTVEWYKDIIT